MSTTTLTSALEHLHDATQTLPNLPFEQQVEVNGAIIEAVDALVKGLEAVNLDALDVDVDITVRAALNLAHECQDHGYPL